MNKTKLIILGAVIGIAALPFLVLAASSYFTVSSSATATTTVTYMTPGTATTTYSFAAASDAAYSTSDIDASFLFLQLIASTSATELNWYYEYSNNNVDWFKDDTTLSGIAYVDHASSTITHRWVNGNTVSSTTRKVLAIPDIGSRYKRVVFSLPIGSPNGSLWIMDTVRRTSK
jgi:hypothetical protein